MRTHALGQGAGVIHGAALTSLQALPTASVQCVITSPPYYGLRKYGTNPEIWCGDDAGAGDHAHVWSEAFCEICKAWRGELGLEPNVQLYIHHLMQIFTELKRVLKDDGTCFVNLGDSYASQGGASRHFGYPDPKYPGGHAEPTAYPQVARPKSLLNIPHRFAIAMTDELHFIQRNEIIWHKPSAMPSSVKDRFTVDFEPIFFFTKSPKYKFNQIVEPYLSKKSAPRNKAAEKYAGTGQFSEGARDYYSQGGKNKRTTWSCAFEPQKEKHFASYPTKLIEPMILAGSDEGDVVLDPFAGTGTTLLTARRLKRAGLGIELHDDYIDIIKRRLACT